MKNFNILKYLVPIALAIVLLLTCRRDNSKPGLVYMPDMVYSRAYETYTKPHISKENTVPLFKDGQTALVPPVGTVPLGYEVYDIEESPEGYNEASLRLENPIPATEENIARGKHIYTIHCTPCHGRKGDGEGTAVVGSDYKLAPPPIKFNNPAPGYLTPGRMFYTITYGKGTMGSYASQVAPEDRWKVIHYIHTLNTNEAVSENEAEDNETADAIDESEIEVNN